MIVRDLMTEQPYAIPESSTVEHAALMMRQHDIGFLPVVSIGADPRLVGVITDRDIAIRCVAKGAAPDSFVAAFMTKEPLATATPEMSVDRLVQVIDRARVRRIPVVDAAGSLVGVVAMGDLVRALGKTEPDTVERVLERVAQAEHAVA
jgi:CBS domain-containing protein